jgi:CRP-like cAMP-binding protein
VKGGGLGSVGAGNSSCTYANYVVIDCSFVTGADINAVGTLSKFKHKLKSHGYANIVYAGLDSSIYSIFAIEDNSQVSKFKTEGDVTDVSESDMEFGDGNFSSSMSPKIWLKTYEGMSKEFYPDVNSALQAVEEDIIDNVPVNMDAVEEGVKRRYSMTTAPNFNELRECDLTPAKGGRAKHLVGYDSSPSLRKYGRSESPPRSTANYDEFFDKADPGKDPITPSIKSLSQQELEDLSTITYMIFSLGSGKWSLSDGPAIKRLARRMLKDVTTVFKGETLWKSGDEATGLSMLLTGRLQAANDNGGKTKYMPGAMVGSQESMNQEFRRRTIVALENSKMATLSKDAMFQIEENDKHMSVVLLKMALFSFSDTDDLQLFDAGSQKRSATELSKAEVDLFDKF